MDDAELEREPEDVGDELQRLVEQAEGMGANAVLAFRFDTSELGSNWTEICAYGTAVRLRPA